MATVPQKCCPDHGEALERIIRTQATSYVLWLCSRPDVVFCKERQCQIDSREPRYTCRQPMCDFVVCETCAAEVGGAAGGSAAGDPNAPTIEGPAAPGPPTGTQSGNLPWWVTLSGGSSGSRAPPRIRSIADDFGLEVDSAAHERWSGLLKAPETAAVGGEGEQELIRSACEVARDLRFLKLTVLSQEELDRKKRGSFFSSSSFGGGRQGARTTKTGNLECYSLFSAVTMPTRRKLIESCASLAQGNRALGAMVGMAAGDTLGAQLEFLEAVDEVNRWRRFDLESFKVVGGKNKFKVKLGQWTDDTSMGLCLADSLLAWGQYSGSDTRVRYHNWWFRGYNNAFGNDDRAGSIGLGGNVAKSLVAMKPHQEPPETYNAETEDSGNGSLMRLAAVPIFYCEDLVRAAYMSAMSSAATHPGPIAAAACAFYGYAIARAIKRKAPAAGADGSAPAESPKAFLDETVQEFLELRDPTLEKYVKCPQLVELLNSSGKHKEACWNWRAPKLEVEKSLYARGSTYNGYPCVRGYFGSYCMDGLGVALWCFYNTTSMMEAVVRSVNFLGDADTNAAITGQLAGAFYGYREIDPRAMEKLEEWDNMDIACRGALLYTFRRSA